MLSAAVVTGALRLNMSTTMRLHGEKRKYQHFSIEKVPYLELYQYVLLKL